MMKKLNFLQLIKEQNQNDERRHLASLCSAGHCTVEEKK